MKLERVFTLITVCILLFSLTSITADPTEDGSDESKDIDQQIDDSLRPDSGRVNHEPFRIEGDTELKEYASSGNGTETNPYIIEGYRINGTGSHYCIYIGNTTDHFVLRDCYIYNASDKRDYNEGKGIHLNGVENAVITGNNFTGNDIALRLTDSNNNTIYENVVTDNLVGINLESSKDNTIHNNFVKYNLWEGIYLEARSDHNKVYDNNATGNGDSIKLIESSNVLIKNNTLGGHNGAIIFRRDSPHCRIINNSITNTYYGIWINGSPNCTIKGNTGTQNTENILIYKSENCSVIENEASRFGWSGNGVRLDKSDGCVVKGNVFNHHFDGISMFSSSSCTISNNTLRNNFDGININRCHHNLISNNTCQGNDFEGMEIHNSSFNDFSDNFLKNNQYHGFYLDECSENEFKENEMLDNGIYIKGDNESHLGSHEIDGSNTVNGKPVIYWKDRSGESLPSEIGQAILFKCRDIEISGFDLSSCTVGFEIFYSTDITIYDNNISDSNYGAYLSASTNCSIRNNLFHKCLNGILTNGTEGYNIVNNTVDHIKIKSCDGTFVKGNRVHELEVLSSHNSIISYNELIGPDDYRSINVEKSDNCTISYNEISHEGDDGVSLEKSRDCVISQNNISSTVDHGIDILTSQNITVRSNNVSSNKGSGMDVARSNGVTIDRNKISSNEKFGIYIIDVDDLYLTGDDILNNSWHGVFASEIDNATISGNDISSNYHGVYSYLSNSTINNNIVMNNKMGLYFGSSDANVISNNTVKNNTDGIFLSKSSDNMIYRNIIWGNGNGTVLVKSTDNSIYLNDIIKNDVQVFSPDNSSYNCTWNSSEGEGNYWSDYEGADDGSGDRTAGDGIGDTKIPHPVDDEGGGYYGLDYYPLMETVNIILLRAEAGEDRTIPVGTTVTFDAGNSSSITGIVNYTWIVRDEKFYGERFDHTFDEIGKYTVELIVRNETGAEDNDTVTVNVVDNTSPAADAGEDRTVAMDDEVQFDASGSTDNTGIISYIWTIEGETYEGKVVTHSFKQTGTYEVELTVKDIGNNTDTDTVEITVEDRTDPTANFEIYGKMKVGKEITFDASTSSDNVGIESYEWDFGDGKSGTGMNVTHQYKNKGDHTVTLKITDESGNTDTYETTITIKEKDDDMPGFTSVILLLSISFIISYFYWKKEDKEDI